MGSGFSHAVYSAVSKSLLKTRIAEPFLLLVYINVFQAVITPVLWLFIKPVFPAPAGWTPLLLASLTCALAYIFLYTALALGDVSSVMPIMGSKVILSSLLAIPLLGESYRWPIYLAVGLVAGSIGILSYSPSQTKSTQFPLKPILMMLICCLVFGFTDIYIKRSLAFLDSYNFMVYYNLLVGIFSLSVIPYLKARGVHLKINRRDQGLCLFAAASLVTATLLFVMLFKLARGVVIPNILMSTRGLFIVVISVVLTLRGSASLEKQSTLVYVMRFIASALIIVSIWITLSN
jgi:drug/metabolite transporter (DMT)-like permease